MNIVKRWLVRICVFLMLGAILNVAVAWGCCLFANRDPKASTRFHRSPTPDDLNWWRSAAAPPGVNEPFEVGQSRVVGYWENRYLGHGPIFTPTTGQPFEITSSANWCEAGWPMRSLRATWFGIPDTSTGRWQHESRGALRLSDTTLAMFPNRAGRLPLYPAWPGFAINTIFYAVLLWLLLGAPFVLRRWRRIRRGLCPKCAYDLRNRPSDSSACPECGATPTR